MDIRLYRFPYLASLLAPTTAPASSSRFQAPTRQGTPIGRSMDGSLADTSGSVDVEPREVDALLAELAQMSGRWELYRRLLYARLTELDDDEADASPPSEPESALDSPTPLPAAKLPPVEAPLADPELPLIEQSTVAQSLRQHLKVSYLPMELWYLRTSIEKAHQIDEIDSTGRPVVSSALDDAFYVLKKVLSRLVSVASASIIADASKEIATIIERDYAGGLRKRIEQALVGVNAAPTTQAPLQLVGGRAREDERERKERDARDTLIVRQ